MNHYININQRAIVENGLDLHPFDTFILDGFKNIFASSSKKIKRMEVNGKIYHWVATKKLMSDLPILSDVMTSKRAWQKRISNLIDQGLLEKIIHGSDSKTYYTQGEKWDCLIGMNIDSPHERRFTPPMNEGSHPPMNEGSSKPNTNNNPNTNTPKKEDESYSGSAMFNKLVETYGLSHGKEEAYQIYRFKSSMIKEAIQKGAEVWREYYEQKGTLGTDMQKSLSNFIRHKIYNEQPPKVAGKEEKQATGYSLPKRYA